MFLYYSWPIIFIHITLFENKGTKLLLAASASGVREGKTLFGARFGRDLGAQQLQADCKRRFHHSCGNWRASPSRFVFSLFQIYFIIYYLLLLLLLLFSLCFEGAFCGRVHEESWGMVWSGCVHCFVGKICRSCFRFAW